LIPTFVIFLREGIEASMIVAILLAYLDRTGQRRYFRDVFAGVGVALAVVVAGGVSAFLLIDRYSGSRVQTIFETATYVVAAVALTYMTFWMNKHARSLSSELARRTDEVISGGSRVGMAVLAATAVGREGIETMVFTLAIVFASAAQAPVTLHSSRLLFVGAFAGLAVAMAVAVSIYKLGRRINLRVFFRVLGITLLIFAAGLVADAVENLQQLGWLPFGRHVMWNTGNMLSESSSVGDLFHSLIGYADRPTLLQVLSWAGYLALAMGAYVGLHGRGHGHRSRHGHRRHHANASGEAMTTESA
jgi:high-affinity iron transporter